MAASQQDLSKAKSLLETRKNNRRDYEELVSGQARIRAKLDSNPVFQGDVDLMSNVDGVMAYAEHINGEKYAVGGYCQKDKELKFHWNPPESI